MLSSSRPSSPTQDPVARSTAPFVLRRALVLLLALAPALATPPAQAASFDGRAHVAVAAQGVRAMHGVRGVRAAHAVRPAPVAHASRRHVCPSTRAVHAHTAAGAHVERAIVCLMNRVRLRSGLRPLHMNRCLDRLAERHARDMVARRYFAHSSASGRSLGQRARVFGYSPRTVHWTVGENLAWGAGPASRALWVVEAWMRSPGHRANILRPSFRHVGVAAVRGIPTGIRGMRHPRTFTVDFGVGGRRCG